MKRVFIHHAHMVTINLPRRQSLPSVITKLLRAYRAVPIWNYDLPLVRDM